MNVKLFSVNQTGPHKAQLPYGPVLVSFTPATEIFPPPPETDHFFSLCARHLQSIAMDLLSISSAIPSPSIFSPKRSFISRRPLLLPISSKNKENEPDLGPDSDNTSLVPFFKNSSSLSHLSNDSAMGFVLSVAVGRGWNTGLGMEGPPAPEAGSD